MRALILSDIHGDGTNLRWLLEQVWKQTGPIDAYFFLGDGVRDFQDAESFIRRRDEHAAMYAVKGNCDFMPGAPERIITSFGGVNLYMTHGHIHRVKSGLGDLRDAARGAGADIALYGHTHVPDIEPGVPMLVNPGAAKDDRCALLEVTDGQPRVWLINLGFA